VIDPPTFLSDLPLAGEAFVFARERHAAQRRDADGSPALMHPLEVAASLRFAGEEDTVVAAGLLHDVLEDTDAERQEVAERFGPEVAEIVDALTEDEAIHDYGQRKAELRERAREAGARAAVVFTADKLSKARELRVLIAARGGADEEIRRKAEHYAYSLDMVDEVIPDHPLVGHLRFQLEALRALPPIPG
jgi:(p)ppGpp synthase/HD superfamily hydrolase